MHFELESASDSNVLSFTKAKKGNKQNLREVPVIELLYAMVVFGALAPDSQKLQMVRDVFMGGIIVDAEYLSAMVPIEVAVAIEEMESKVFGSAAGLMQRMGGGGSVSGALAARLKDKEQVR